MQSVCVCGVPYSLAGNPESGAIISEGCQQIIWPTWARTIARFRKPEDVGIGDTFHRIAERFGVERVIKALKINCGCQVRRENWNAEYAYDGDTR